MCDDGNELCYIDYFCWDKSVLKRYDLDVSKNLFQLKKRLMERQVVIRIY